MLLPDEPASIGLAWWPEMNGMSDQKDVFSPVPMEMLQEFATEWLLIQFDSAGDIDQ